MRGRKRMTYDGRDPRRPYYADRPNYPEWGTEPAWQPPQPDPPRTRLPLRFRILLWGPLALLSAVAAAVGALFIYYTVIFPDPLSMRLKSTGPVIRIMARDGS